MRGRIRHQKRLGLDKINTFRLRLSYRDSIKRYNNTLDDLGLKPVDPTKIIVVLNPDE